MTPDPIQIASSWLQQYGYSLASGDSEGTASCFQPDGFLRDILVFTWNNRTLKGHEKITAYLGDTLRSTCITAVELETRHGLVPESGGFHAQLISPVAETVSAGFTFRCKVGRGQGYFVLIPTDAGEWKAISVMMQLADISGHEEWILEEGVYGGHTLSWTDVDRERRQAIEKNPYVLIVGAGHTGLNLAAKFRHMNIPSLVVESNLRVGDNWRKRYPTLTLHTPKVYTELLYQSFPQTWPIYAPRDKIADWLEQYVQSQDLVVWTNSRPLPSPTFDITSRRWTVVIDHAGQQVTLNPAHIVVAAGAFGEPNIPVIDNKEAFGGPVMHYADYNGAKPFAGKKVVVVGAGNTSADICQDLSFHGAESVTMVQRSATYVIAVTSVREMLEPLYHEGFGTDVADFRLIAQPMGLLQQKAKQSEALLLEQQKETHKGLREAGYHLITDQSLFSLFQGGYGGYSLDVGCAELIRSGKVKIKHGVEVARLGENSVVFTDGSSLEADTVILATSFKSIRDKMRGLFGDEIIDQTSPVWGLDDEGEIRGCYRPSGHPGLWFAAGEFFTSRARTKQLALEIKAIELGLLKL
ncbi:FAD/NAD-P-binding domain-containing protein [Mycena metata]|uniref:FAD/NAD-P-binding domain-containing protein n=1 Tax=Mycena metata TaxID=1033252 RepID=A0AAD7NQJ2_9AGAR|nr:FAD/NAD-P-binding domain-containing protein [Mycena metata]